jgi:hypothetical protein
VSRVTTTPSRAKLAVERIAAVLREVDYDCGHFITGDNLKIVDVQILLEAFYGERADVLAFLRAEANAARHAQASAADDHPDIENWHHINSASAIEARRAETAQTGSVHESAVAESETPNNSREVTHTPTGGDL